MAGRFPHPDPQHPHQLPVHLASVRWYVQRTTGTDRHPKERTATSLLDIAAVKTELVYLYQGAVLSLSRNTLTDCFSLILLSRLLSDLALRLILKPRHVCYICYVSTSFQIRFIQND